MVQSIGYDLFSEDAWNEAESLIRILRLWGVHYLMGEEHLVSLEDQRTDLQTACRLIIRLAQCPYPRVRDAGISLFLLHPELAPAVLDAMKASTEHIAEQIATLTLASLYLQRFWSIRFLLAFGYPPSFPEPPFAFLWRAHQLPPPSADFGACGLKALQEAEQRRTGLPFNFIEDWQNQVRHLLLQEEAEHRQYLGPLHVVPALPEQEQENYSMSMRPNVDKQKIEQFLKDLGRAYRSGGRLYLVGGAALVHAGIRGGSTQDIDLEASDGNLITTIQQVGQRLNINIEFAAPGDFIPLPRQWQAMSQYVGRYGSIDVFYFDFYSLALSKIDRGSSRDITDVQLLVGQQVITLAKLDAAFQEVVSQMGHGSYVKLKPADFTRKYQSVRQNL